MATISKFYSPFFSTVAMLPVLHQSFPAYPGPVGYVIAAILGAASHRFYFIRGEHHLKIVIYIALLPIVSAVLFGAIYHHAKSLNPSGSRSADALAAVLSLNFIFLASLYSSMVWYRVFEHHLRNFDGPRLAAVSKLWHFAQLLKRSNHLVLDDLHRKYGKIVRTGPQELTIFDPGVWQIINNPTSGCIKSPFYEQLWPIKPINSIRSKAQYAPRRRKWDEAMNALTKKETRLYHFCKIFSEHIRSHAGSPINMTTWFRNITFDIMGDLGFGKSFALSHDLDSVAKEHSVITSLQQAFRVIGLMTPIVWMIGLIVPLALVLPWATERWSKAMTWTATLCDERVQKVSQEIGADGKAGNDDDSNDKSTSSTASTAIFSRFILAANHDGRVSSLERLTLYGDTLVITIGGSDTTSGVLTMLFYELAAHVDVQNQLREEIASADISFDEPVSPEMLNRIAQRKIPYLDACINETMRMHPVVPTGGIRQTVDKGFYLDEEWIPPDTVLVTPRWSIMRLESAFAQPNDFIPERWTTRPEMVKDSRAFNSFSFGRHSCPGRQLAMMELRMMVAMIVSNFSFVLSPSAASKTSAVDDFEDHFTAVPGKLELVFTPLGEK